jgi:uncharacterized protein with PIN domain
MRLLCDVMCGKLATYLRMCGHDTAYALDAGVEDDDAILRWADREDRRLVTRDVSLAAQQEGAFLLRSREVPAQLAELREQGVRLELAAEPERCGRCNGPLERYAGERPDYAPDEGPVWRCRDCGQLFWKGSHWDDVRERLAAGDSRR